MKATAWIATAALLLTVFTAPSALAHESYDIGGGEYTVTVGDQNEPMYTFKWTNLDLIIRDSEGQPVALEENEQGKIAALDAVLVAPGGEELDGELEAQFGEEGRYEFNDGYFYTQPGQYTLRLDGDIKGVNATGTYDLPGPRQAGNQFAFPHEDVPTVLDLQDRVQALEGDGDEQDLQQRIDELESQVATLEQEIQTLSENQQQLEEEKNSAPGFGAGAALAAIGAIAVLGLRRNT